MNKIKLLIGLSVSFATGVACGILGSNKYWKFKYEKLYQEDKELLYIDRRNYVQEIPPVIKIYDNVDELTDKKRAELKENIRNNKNVRATDYSKMYKQKKENNKNKKRADEACTRSDQNDEEEWTDESIQVWYDEHKGDGPEIINYDDIKRLPPNIEVSNLDLYYFDNSLVDVMNDEEIEDPETFVGGCLDNFCDDDEEQIVILNASLDSVYVVNKIMDSFSNPDPE